MPNLSRMLKLRVLSFFFFFLKRLHLLTYSSSYLSHGLFFKQLIYYYNWRRPWQPIPGFLPGESPWIEEPGGLQSMGSQRVRHDWVTNTHTHIRGPIKCYGPSLYEMQLVREERNWKLKDIEKSQSPRNQTDCLWSPSLTGLNGFHTAGATFLEPHSIVLLHISISDHNPHLENGQRRFNLKPWARPHF